MVGVSLSGEIFATTFDQISHGIKSIRFFPLMVGGP